MQGGGNDEGQGPEGACVIEVPRAILLEDSARRGISLQQGKAFAFRLIQPWPGLG